jgi:hypothetical protein
MPCLPTVYVAQRIDFKNEDINCRVVVHPYRYNNINCGIFLSQNINVTKYGCSLSLWEQGKYKLTCNKIRISFWDCMNINIFLVNDQLDAQFFSMHLFQISTCFEQPRAHHQEKQLYQYNLWYMSLCVNDHIVCRSDLDMIRSSTQSDINQRLYWYNCFSWRWARGCSKHIEIGNKDIEKNCASSWSFTKKRNEMHGQYNIKNQYTGIVADSHTICSQILLTFLTFKIFECQLRISK